MGLLITGDYEKMEATDSLNSDLIDFEAQIASELDKIKPDLIFVDDLRNRLLNSRVFEYRRSIGAIVVASLSILLTGTLAYTIGKLAKKTKKIVLR